MAMCPGQEAGAQDRSRRRRARRTVWLLGAPVVVAVLALAFYLWDRPRAPQAVTVASLQSLADLSALVLGIWPADQPRTVRLLVRRGPARMAGTAGPSGVQLANVTLPGGASWSDLSPIWHGDSLAYIDESAGAVYVCSPWWAPPRKLTDFGAQGAAAPLTWLPDGDRLTVVLGDPDGGTKCVRAFSSDGDLIAEAPSPTTPECWTGAQWSPSARRLLLWQESTPCHGLVLSAPDWRSAPIPFPSLNERPILWLNDDVLVAWTVTVRPVGHRRLIFFRLPGGNQLGSFDCSEVRFGGARVAVEPWGAQAAPSGAGVIVAVGGISSGTVALERSATRLSSWDQQRLAFNARALGEAASEWPPPRVAYVYVPVSGRGARVIAIGDTASWRSCFAVSADGRELLYISNWQLKAAPLPPEARRRPGR